MADDDREIDETGAIDGRCVENLGGFTMVAEPETNGEEPQEHPESHGGTARDTSALRDRLLKWKSRSSH